MNDQIIINNKPFDKVLLLELINKNKKIQAIKYIKDETNIGLKHAKDIVDNLSENPEFYSNTNNVIKKTTVKSRSIKKPQDRSRNSRGSHIIKNKTTVSKNLIILFLLMIIFYLIYLLL